jgi:hypothetical protein
MKKELLIFITLLFFKVSYSQNLTGRWKIDADIKSLGNIQMLVNFEKTSDSTFFASSRPKALKEILGGIQYAIAKNSKLYKDGSIVHIYNGVIKSDSLKGVLTTPIMSLYFEAHIENGKMTGGLFGNDKKSTYYKFTAIPYEKEFIEYDYKNLIESIKTTFQKNIYDAEILKTKDWSTFFMKLDRLAPKIHDDIEMFMDFSFLANKIKMSHVAILKYNPWDNFKENDTSKITPLVSHKIIDEKTAYLKFEGFQLDDTLIVRQFFKSIIDKKIPNLIIDLRGCGGGDYSSMFLANYLIRETIDAGYFIGNKYFQSNRQLPDKQVLEKMNEYKGNSLKEFLENIVSNGLLKGKVTPDKELHYQGKVYTLIDNNSASATEPIAYFLKQQKLSSLVGETTAGKMLSSTVITCKDNWSLMIPVADYYTADGYRIEQKGVKPDTKVKSAEALDYILKRINK